MENKTAATTDNATGQKSLSVLLDETEERAKMAVSAWRSGADDAETVLIAETDVPKLVNIIRGLEAALKEIARKAVEWNANQLGGVDLQRKRWQKAGRIASEALWKASIITNVGERESEAVKE